MLLKRNGDWLSARNGDEVMMMSAQSGSYLAISEVGASIWELIKTPADLDSVCSAIMAEFDVDERQCRADVRAFAEEMERHGAIAIDHK